MPKVLKWIPPIKEPYALYLMIRDPRIPLHSKLYSLAIIGLIFVYTFSPLDIVPDYLPVLGWMDDLVLFPLGIFFIEKILPRNILAEKQSIASRRVNRAILVVVLGVVAFILMWALALTAFVLLILHLVNG